MLHVNSALRLTGRGLQFDKVFRGPRRLSRQLSSGLA
jgi:hypothetical protein